MPDENAKPAKGALRASWFWLSILTVFLWGAWGLQSKVIIDRISPWMNQVLFPLGFLPITVAMLFSKNRSRAVNPRKGAMHGFGTGLLGGTGNIAFYMALALGGQASIVVPLAGLAPLVTVALAYVVLKESLTRLQVVGVGFAMVSIYLLSI